MLRTYDPHHPEWGADTTEQASAHERLAFGLLIEQGPKTATKQLCVFHGDDAQEQAGHRLIRYMIEELLSGSSLSRRLLKTLSFLFVPWMSQQAVRDGWSRFPYDCPPPGVSPNTGANGGSRVGEAVLARAVTNWLSDHPDPANGLFCEGSFHCDVPNRYGEGDVSTPAVAPYTQMQFPGGVAVFRGGWDGVMWPEMQKPGTLGDTTAPYGIVLGEFNPSAKFYFESPWRYAGHSAFFRFEDDAHQTFARAMLSGMAQAVGATIDLAPNVEIVAEAGVSATLKKIARPGAAVSAGAAVSCAFVKFIAATSGAVARVSATLAAKRPISASVAAAAGAAAFIGHARPLTASVQGAAGVAVTLRKRTVWTATVTAEALADAGIAFSGFIAQVRTTAGVSATLVSLRRPIVTVQASAAVAAGVVNPQAFRPGAPVGEVRLDVSVPEVVLRLDGAETTLRI